jgi:transcription elongation factor
LKKDDLVKTNKNQIGIVLETTKDNIKILDTNNTIQIIGNMEVDSKLNTRNIVAKNKTGDEISADCAIIIRHGVNEV